MYTKVVVEAALEAEIDRLQRCQEQYDMAIAVEEEETRQQLSAERSDARIRLRALLDASEAGEKLSQKDFQNKSEQGSYRSEFPSILNVLTDRYAASEMGASEVRFDPEHGEPDTSIARLRMTLAEINAMAAKDSDVLSKTTLANLGIDAKRVATLVGRKAIRDQDKARSDA